jgi:alpha-glucosidase
LRALAASLIFAAVGLPAPPREPARVQRLASPDGRIEVVVRADDKLAYDVLWRGKPLLSGATLALDVDHVRLGVAPQLVKATRRSVDGRVEPPVRQKAAVLPDQYNELRLDCAGGYAVTFRAYDQGVAYRFETALPRTQVKVFGEEAGFAFADAETAYFPLEEGFFSHNEPLYQHLELAKIAPAMRATLPAVVETAAGPKVAIAESDVEGYPGLWLRGTSGPGLQATFPPYPLEEKAVRDRDVKVVRAADYIAVTRGTRTFPWRLLAIAPTDADLVTSTLVYLLARPSQIADTSWIRPGKVAWDWWNDRNFAGVSFKPGINTDTYKAYIDFASRYGLEYVILDEGWYKTGDVLSVVPAIDMPALLAYARAKNVGLILWVVWKTFADQMEPALAQFEKWGVKGLKIDFMQRDDQPVVDWYHAVCRALAARHMLVDFHGGQRPALMTRTWPNIVSTEGVKGLEHDKWSKLSDPAHTTVLPFSRMLLGPMDYTPGAMLNATREAFKIDFHRPMSLGTRCHQLGMYVVYESPLQMLADSPTNYEGEPEAMEFLRFVPTTWDETRVLAAKMGAYVAVARRHGADWYVGALNDWTARVIDLDLSFLDTGASRPGPGGKQDWEMVSWSDGPDANTDAQSFRRTTTVVGREALLHVGLAPGGGLAARISRRSTARTPRKP